MNSITRFFSRPRPWITVITIAFLLAIVTSTWPSVQCAFGQCNQRYLWCNPDCSQGCKPATRLGYITKCEYSNSLGFCKDNWNPDKAPVRCIDSNNCNVTVALAESDRLDDERPDGYSYWNVKNCSRTINDDNTCNAPVNRWVRVDCCTGAPSPTQPAPCTPRYAPPSVSLAGTTPPYPLTIGQDPDQLGFDATIVAEGGRKTNNCNRGPAQRDLTSLTLDSLELSKDTISWIEHDLAIFYPGARVKDVYPQHPYATVNINGKTGSLVFHHDPLDPGVYEAHVTAVQDNGQEITVVLEIPVYLLEATIVR